MTKLRKTVLCCVIAAAAISAHATRAEGLSLGVTTGLWTPDDAYKIDADNFLALSLGYRLASAWSVEASYLQTQADLKTRPVQADFDQWRLDLIYQTSWNERLLPFFLVGVGRQTISLPEREPGNQLVAAALGADWRLSARLSLRGELRTWQDTDYDTVNHSFGLGLRWQLGSLAPDDEDNSFLMNADADGDAVRDRSDRCPDTPPHAEVDAYGCEMSADDKSGLAR